jgi:hypothetical protein
VTPVEVYDRSDWDMCVVDGCPNLFTDGCPGPGACPRARQLAQGIQIYVVLDGADASFVTTIARRN